MLDIQKELMEQINLVRELLKNNTTLNFPDFTDKTQSPAMISHMPGQVQEPKWNSGKKFGVLLSLVVVRHMSSQIQVLKQKSGHTTDSFPSQCLQHSLDGHMLWLLESPERRNTDINKTVYKAAGRHFWPSSTTSTWGSGSQTVVSKPLGVIRKKVMVDFIFVSLKFQTHH